MAMKNNTEDIDLKLFNIGLRLRSGQKELTDFIKFFTGLSTNETEILEPQIYVNFKLDRTFPIDKNYNKISRSIWLGDSSVFISEIERFPGLSLKVREKNNKLHIDAFLGERKLKSFKRLLHSLGTYKKEKLFKSIGLVYYLIYFPYLYYLERFCDFYLLHAAAFEYKQKGIILSGLGGAGKSTFLLGTPSLDGCKILSDNLIFHDTEKIYPFPEPIALNPKSTNILGQTEKILIPTKIPSTHDRMYYQIKPEIFSRGAIPRYLFWLQLGNENKIVPLEKEVCIKNLLNINLLAKELREYYVLAAALDLAFSQSLSPNSYFQNLSRLLSNLDCFILQFKPGDDIKTIFSETLAKVIL